MLWQHLFWFFGHPEVYVVLLPAMGIVAEIITVFARKKLFAYKTVLYTVLRHRRAQLHGLGPPPVHRRHRSAHGPRLHGHDAADLHPNRRDDVRLHRHPLRGVDHLTTPMLWALSFIADVPDRRRDRHLPGGQLAKTSTLHDTYFVLAHFHYTFFPIAIIGTFAGMTYWFPKMFGRMMNETLGKIHFWGTIIPST